MFEQSRRQAISADPQNVRSDVVQAWANRTRTFAGDPASAAVGQQAANGSRSATNAPV
jgi:hypothetical protein